MMASHPRAMTNPSPPLLPFPQRTATRSLQHPFKFRPAFSISTMPGMPSFSMEMRSISRICAAVRIFMEAAR